MDGREGEEWCLLLRLRSMAWLASGRGGVDVQARGSVLALELGWELRPLVLLLLLVCFLSRDEVLELDEGWMGLGSLLWLVWAGLCVALDADVEVEVEALAGESVEVEVGGDDGRKSITRVGASPGYTAIGTSRALRQLVKEAASISYTGPRVSQELRVSFWWVRMLSLHFEA